MTFIGYAWKVTKGAMVFAWENKTRTLIWPLAMGESTSWLIKLIKEKKKKYYFLKIQHIVSKEFKRAYVHLKK